MTLDQSQFIQIINDHLNNRPTTITLNNPDVLVRYASKHELEGILYYQTHIQALESKYKYCLYNYYNRLNTLSTIDNVFKDNNIDYFILKGTELAKYYPQPSLRQMGDSDIVVKDTDKAVDALNHLGFNASKEAFHEIHFTVNELPYELHNKLIFEVYGESLNEPALMTFFNNCWPYVSNDTLDPNFHFLFTIVHLRKHFINGGVGFRQFIDLALFSKENLDWQFIINKLTELDLLEFSKICFALIERWFNIACPLEHADLTESFYQEATNVIFENGVFGKDDTIASLTNRLNKSSKSKVMISLLFPSYNTMIQSSSYNFLKGKPYLLPLAWIYRYITAFNKGKNKVNTLYSNDVAVNKRNEELKKWKI